MSSLAAARADNFYYGPEYGPQHGSLNKYRGSHGALGDRAKRLHEGVLIIRFEMPFKVFCNGCNRVIAKGVRFNAEKRTVGNYYSTKIYEFTMKCLSCPNRMVIRTDPKNADYVMYSGLRKKHEDYYSDDEDTNVVVTNLAIATGGPESTTMPDPMAKLEETMGTSGLGFSSTGSFGKSGRNREAEERIQGLLRHQEARHSSDTQFELNARARAQMRVRRRAAQKKASNRNFILELAAETNADRQEARAIRFASKHYASPAALVRDKLKSKVPESIFIRKSKRS